VDKKIVCYTQRVEYIDSYEERRDCADQNISNFIYSCGYIPMAVPNVPIIAHEIIEKIHPNGIILTGGNSMMKYGGDAPDRDEIDALLIDYGISNKTPVYGFCRGMQSILDYYGNELVNVTGHVAVRHDIFGQEDEMDVNSYHNQGCMNLLSDELKVVMQTEDGVIEKIRHVSLPIIGTMWHPEREKPFRDSDIRMVRELFGGK